MAIVLDQVNQAQAQKKGPSAHSTSSHTSQPTAAVSDTRNYGGAVSGAATAEQQAAFRALQAAQTQQPAQQQTAGGSSLPSNWSSMSEADKRNYAAAQQTTFHDVAPAVTQPEKPPEQPQQQDKMYYSDYLRLTGQDGGSAAPQAVTYIDGNGQRATGTVQQPAQPSYWDTMRDLYQQMYDEQVAANNQALEDARARAQEATDAQLEALRTGYQGTNRQLYRDYMENQRTLPQQMAAQGYSGGLSESSRLRLGNAYQEALAENERARLAEESGANQALAQQLYEAQQAANTANNQAAQNRYGYLAALREAQYNQERADLEARAAMMGSVGDFSAYAQLGYTPAEIARLQAYWNAQHAPATSSGGGGRRSSSGSNNQDLVKSLTSSSYMSVLNGATSLMDVNAGLQQAVNSGDITQAQASQIYSQAQAAANERANRRNQAAAYQSRDRGL